MKTSTEPDENGNYKYKVSVGHGQSFMYFFIFICLVPLHPNNASKEEIMDWLDFLMDFWKEVPTNVLYRDLFGYLLSELMYNFKDIDLSKYNKWLLYQASLTLKGIKSNESYKPLGNVYLERHFARYVLWNYVPKRLRTKDESKSHNYFELEHLLSNFKERLHPEHSSTKVPCIKFIKLLSSTLCSRVKEERRVKAEEPDNPLNELCLEQEDISYFINLLKPYLDLTMQGHSLLAYVSR